MRRSGLAKLPSFLDRKIYKTGQTRGADDDDILQNRVARNSTALFPYSVWNPATCFPAERPFERGYIVLIEPEDHAAGVWRQRDPDLVLGRNLLVFYQTRGAWEAYPPSAEWRPANLRPDRPTDNRTSLGGEYVARIAATVATQKITHGFAGTTNKGAGIQGFEYASSRALEFSRLQLEGIFWSCADALDVMVASEMTQDAATHRAHAVVEKCKELGLWDLGRLAAARILDGENRTICPLCLDRLSAAGFLSRLAQADGRATPDLTVTEINLFHIEELRYGAFKHEPYNLGWGHHHCNATARDMGIDKTVEWMESILRRNREYDELLAATGVREER